MCVKVADTCPFVFDSVPIYIRLKKCVIKMLQKKYLC